MSNPVIEPQITDHSSTADDRWMVVIFNNDHNSFEDVILILMLATGCDIQEAKMETWEADHYGKAPVHFASQKECKRVAKIIEEVGVRTEVRPEWDD